MAFEQIRHSLLWEIPSDLQLRVLAHSYAEFSICVLAHSYAEFSIFM